jgi:very-short-patch-repair endonuclease
MPRPEAHEPSMWFLVERAREMRKQPTASEAMLWERLRRGQLGVRFRRQHPVPPYIIDFYAPSVKLAVEVDGASHDAARDAQRDAWLARSGIRVLRVKAWRVERHVSVVLEVIRAAL